MSKNRVNLYDVVSRVVQLKRAGRQWVGLSPFTNEKTPSFYVTPDKGFYKCFSSGETGDLFTFVMKTENLTFPEAVEVIAERFQIPLEYAAGKQVSQEQRSLRKQLLELHEYAADYFHTFLMGKTAEAATVRAYWQEQRKFTLEVAKDYKIGLAPVDGNECARYLARKGFGMEALHQCGLFLAQGHATDPSALRARFRGRLMIPIRDNQGQVVAFTARQLDITPADDPTARAKYVNSPETPLFHKSKLLFHLDRARTKVGTDKPFILVEGQLDAIRCAVSGFENTVAPQGTAVTEEQMFLLRRYHDRILVVLDGDNAGKNAAIRVLPLALKADLGIEFVELPAGLDPDSVLVQQGPDAFKQLLGTAREAMDFACRFHCPDNHADPHEKANALQKLWPVLAGCSSEVARSEYLRAAARALDVDYDGAAKDFARFMSQNRSTPPAHKPQPEKNAELSDKPLTTPEFELLLLVLQNDRLVQPLSEIIQHDWIRSDTHEGRLLGRIFAAVQQNAWEGVQNMEHLFETVEDRSAFYAAMAEEREFREPVKVANHIAERMYLRFLKREIRNIDTLIAQPDLPAEEMMSLLTQRSILSRHCLQPKLPTLTAGNESA
ncbi:MAG: DNA primase [Verrucomicrobia bacterium]|nr:DNA primase [Verrucomicrobiota bacterium]